MRRVRRKKKNIKRKCLLFFVIISFIVSVFLFRENIISLYKSYKIDRILQTKEYSYLPKMAQNYVREIYDKTGEVVLTEKNKKNNTPYLNPDFVDYLTLDDETKNGQDLLPNPYIVDYQSAGIESSGNDLPTTYDLRDVNGNSYITPIKNQRNLGLCWAFSTIEQAESYLMVKKQQPYNSNSELFSVRQLDYATSADGIKNYKNEYGVRNLTSGGLFEIAIDAISNGVSLINDSDMPYNNEKNQKNLYDILNYNKSKYEANSTINMPVLWQNSSQETRNNYINLVKENIKKYGGAYVGTGSPSGSCGAKNYYDNISIIHDEPLCHDDKDFGGHAMQIIGWDDNYSYKYCKGNTHTHYDGNPETCTTKEGQGAWIIRNSWGDSTSYKYVYLAYDSVYVNIDFITDLTETDEKTWDNSYGEVLDYYDNIAQKNITKEIKKNVDNTEKVNKVKFVTGSYNGRYNITINNKSRTIETTLPGLYTVDLSDLNIIIDDEEFEVNIKSLNDTYLYNNIFVYTTNILNSNQVIKTEDKEFTSSIMNISDTGGYEFSLYSVTRGIPSSGEIVYKLFKNENEVSDLISYTNNYVAENNVNSDIVIDESISAGEYTLKTYYKKNNQEITCNSCSSKLFFGESIHLNGDGTKYSPYLINNQTELSAMKYNLKAFYRLNKDIELTGEWEPIGTEEKPFEGTFDGNNHYIKDLKVTDSLYGGLFGVISNKEYNNSDVEIKNIKIKGFDISAGSYAGAVVGKVNYIYSTGNLIDFSNIFVYDSVLTSTNGNIGSIVGQVSCDKGRTINFNNIFSNATLKGGNYAGGIIGLTDYTPVELEKIQFVGDIITNHELKDRKNYGTILNYPDTSGIEPTGIDNVYTGFSVSDSISNGIIIGKDYIHTHIFNFGFDKPNYNLLDFSYLKKNYDLYNYDLSAEPSYTKFNSILDMKDINKYNYDIDTYTWQFKTIDGISRIPVLRNVEFEYTNIDDIGINVDETINLLDYITPETRPCRLMMDTSNTSDIISIENSNDSACDYDINIRGNKKGSTTIHVISDYDGYEKDINITVNDNSLKGDMNKNSKIDLKDIILLIRKYIGSEATTNNDIQIGDMNSNSKLDLKDIILLIRTYLGTN